MSEPNVEDLVARVTAIGDRYRAIPSAAEPEIVEIDDLYDDRSGFPR